MITVLHLITGLVPGGAEHMLYRLVRDIDRTRFRSVVVAMVGGGPVGEKIEAAGVPVISLDMRRGGVPGPFAAFRFASILRRWKPNVVMTWLYHADVFGMMTKATNAALLWNVRCSNMTADRHSRRSRLVIRIAARASKLPDAVVVNSRSGMAWHESLGYQPRRWVYLPNGVDLVRFRPDPAARASVREELGLGGETPLIGMMARFDPMKDHATFLDAASSIAATRGDAHFVLSGDGTGLDNAALREHSARAGLTGRLHLLGYRADVSRIVAALDVAVLSSAYGEGFPNAIAEAMACGVPCVATDVGDSAAIVGPHGRIVPPRAPGELADAVLDLLARSGQARAELSAALRRRMEESFSMESTVRSYEALFTEYAVRR